MPLKGNIPWNKDKKGLQPSTRKGIKGIYKYPNRKKSGPHTEEHKKKISIGNFKHGLSHTNGYMKNYHQTKREKQAGRPKPEQCELCGIFGKDLKQGLCFDHDHVTGKFRGWICGRCNTALGMVNDNCELLLKMVEYLEVAKIEAGVPVE